MSSEQPTQPWYTQTWVVVVALVLFFPLGLFLMWRFQRWEVWIKTVITVAGSLLAIFIIVGAAIGGEDEDGEAVMQKATPSPTVAASPSPTIEAPTPSPEPTPTPEPEPTPTPTPEPEPTEAPSGASYSEDDPEYQLASIDAGEQLSLDDPLIGVYASLLDELDAKCEEERSLIGDQAVRATQLLADEGITVTVLNALSGFNESIPDDFQIVSCADIGAAWIVLTINQ